VPFAEENCIFNVQKNVLAFTFLFSLHVHRSRKKYGERQTGHHAQVLKNVN
jgi:hypothetical protein